MVIGSIHHVSICVADLEASRGFYVGVLGLQEVDRPASFQFKGQWFRKNGCEIHTIHTSAAGQEPGDGKNVVRPGRDITFARHFCLRVASMGQAIETLKARNISIAAGPRDRGDGALQLFLYDPDGHLVELVYEPWENGK